MPKYSSFYCSQLAQSFTSCEDIVFLLPPGPGLCSMMPQPHYTISLAIAYINAENTTLVPRKQSIPRQGRSMIEKVVQALFCFQYVFGDISKRRKGHRLLQPRRGSTAHLLLRRQGHKARPEKVFEETNSQRMHVNSWRRRATRLYSGRSRTHTPPSGKPEKKGPPRDVHFKLYRPGALLLHRYFRYSRECSHFDKRQAMWEWSRYACSSPLSIHPFHRLRVSWRGRAVAPAALHSTVQTAGPTG